MIKTLPHRQAQQANLTRTIPWLRLSSKVNLGCTSLQLRTNPTVKSHESLDLSQFIDNFMTLLDLLNVITAHRLLFWQLHSIPWYMENGGMVLLPSGLYILTGNKSYQDIFWWLKGKDFLRKRMGEVHYIWHYLWKGEWHFLTGFWTCYFKDDSWQRTVRKKSVMTI